MNLRAQLIIDSFVTDGSSINASVTGVLAYYSVYEVVLRSSDGSLPDGDYVVQLWNNLTLVASTDYDFDSSAVPDSSSVFAGDSSIDSSEAKEESTIQVVNGVGYGILDLRTEEAQVLSQNNESTGLTLVIYDYNHYYMPARTSATLIRNEAGELASDVSLAGEHTIHGTKTFEEFPKFPSGTPDGPLEGVHKQYADSLIDNSQYDSSWDGDSAHAPSKNAVYDKIESVETGAKEHAEDLIDNSQYDSSWDGDSSHAPSKNAVYDKMNSHENDVDAHHDRYTDSEARKAVRQISDSSSFPQNVPLTDLGLPEDNNRLNVTKNYPGLVPKLPSHDSSSSGVIGNTFKVLNALKNWILLRFRNFSIDTLANLNNIISDATLDDASSPRDPTTHGSEAHTDDAHIDVYVEGGDSSAQRYSALSYINFKSGFNIIEESDGGLTIESLGTDSGSAGGGTGGGGLSWSRISSDTNAASGNGYLIDASANNIVLTLNASPTEGDAVGASDYTESATTNSIKIAGNGNKIEGSNEDLIIDVDGAGFTLVWTGDTNYGWKIVTEISYGGSADSGSTSSTSGMVNTLAEITAKAFEYPGENLVNPFSNAANSSNVSIDVENFGDKAIVVSTSSNEPLQFPNRFEIPSEATSLKFRFVFAPMNYDSSGEENWENESVVFKGELKSVSHGMEWSNVKSFNIITCNPGDSSGDNTVQVVETTVNLNDSDSSSANDLNVSVGDIIQMVIFVDSSSTYSHDIALFAIEVEAN